MDAEAINVWKEAFSRVGISVDLDNRIYAYPKKKNWWELAGPGPCGPDTEIFYDTRPDSRWKKGDANPLSKAHGRAMSIAIAANIVEIWNNVFMEYEKRSDGKGGWQYFPLKAEKCGYRHGL